MKIGIIKCIIVVLGILYFMPEIHLNKFKLEFFELEFGRSVTLTRGTLVLLIVFFTISLMLTYIKHNLERYGTDEQSDDGRFGFGWTENHRSNRKKANIAVQKHRVQVVLFMLFDVSILGLVGIILVDFLRSYFNS